MFARSCARRAIGAATGASLIAFALKLGLSGR
jgi:hypothetical protein